MNTTNSILHLPYPPQIPFSFQKEIHRKKRGSEIIPFHCSPPPKKNPSSFCHSMHQHTHTHIDISPTISLDWLGFVHDSVYPITHNPHSQTQHSLHCMFQPSYKHAIPQQNSATCVQRLDDSQNLQFTLLIALCYVLHRYTTQEIRR